MYYNEGVASKIRYFSSIFFLIYIIVNESSITEQDVFLLKEFFRYFLEHNLTFWEQNQCTVSQCLCKLETLREHWHLSSGGHFFSPECLVLGSSSPCWWTAVIHSHQWRTLSDTPVTPEGPPGPRVHEWRCTARASTCWGLLNISHPLGEYNDENLKCLVGLWRESGLSVWPVFLFFLLCLPHSDPYLVPWPGPRVPPHYVLSAFSMVTGI